MPTKIKKRQRINNNELDPWDLRYLMMGNSMLPIDERESRMKAIWEKHKKYIMSYYADGEQYTGEDETMQIVIRQAEPTPGTRPFAWWKWDSKEKVKQILEDCPKQHYCQNFKWEPCITSRYIFVKRCGKSESQLDYLTRLNLLTENEKELLKRN